MHSPWLYHATMSWQELTRLHHHLSASHPCISSRCRPDDPGAYFVAFFCKGEIKDPKPARKPSHLFGSLLLYSSHLLFFLLLSHTTTKQRPHSHLLPTPKMRPFLCSFTLTVSMLLLLNPHTALAEPLPAFSFAKRDNTVYGKLQAKLTSSCLFFHAVLSIIVYDTLTSCNSTFSHCH